MPEWPWKKSRFLREKISPHPTSALLVKFHQPNNGVMVLANTGGGGCLRKYIYGAPKAPSLFR
jgi:hypothetical protein